MNDASLVGHILELIEESDRNAQPLDRLVGDFFRARRYLGSHDRRFVAETLYGIIRHRRFLEALLERYVQVNPAEAALDAPRARYLALVHLALVLPAAEDAPAAAGAVPSLPPAPGDGGSAHAVSPSYWKTMFPGTEIGTFTSWALEHRSLDFLTGEEEAVRLGVRYSFQDWMAGAWIAQLGGPARAEPLLASLNRQAPTSLRVNLLKTSREECRKRLLREGVETDLTRYSPAGLVARKRFTIQSSAAFREGWFEVQDEGSQIVSCLVDPRPGEKVIDGCAGAGGKTLHMAELMRNEGDLLAVDSEPRRLEELGRRAGRNGVRNLRTHLQGSAPPLPPSGGGEEPMRADAVLVDAPCSGVGTIRRNPMLKWRVTPSLVRHYTGLQRELLAFNAQFVRKAGGRLVYATCSMLREENEEIVRAFLERNPDFSPAPPRDQLERLGLAGAAGEEGAVRLYPHREGTDGFFIAVMARAAA